MVQGYIQSVTFPHIGSLVKTHTLIAMFFLLNACANIAPLTTNTISNNTAVVTLVEDARLLSDEGKHEQAKSKLERALRLEPNNGALWFELAFTNKEQGNIRNARSLAERAQRLSHGQALSNDVAALIEELDSYK
ncbi:MAG: tetratricopeptide repeat protein [Agarilytica sp.]